MVYYLLIFIFLLSSTSISHAGGAVAKRSKKPKGVRIQHEIMVQQQKLQQQQEMEAILKENEINAVMPEDVNVEDVVNIEEIWKSLETSSQIWDLMIDQEAKIETVMHFMNIFRERGVVISKPPAYYVNLIDTMAANNPAILINPFEQVLQVIAILEYDFNNGQDKDEMARKFLDPQAFLNNKKRLGLVK